MHGTGMSFILFFLRSTHGGLQNPPESLGRGVSASHTCLWNR